MAKIEDQDFKVEMQIKAIELLNGSLNLPANANTPATNFNFNIGIESRADAVNKLVFVIVLGALSLSCIFEIANFEDLIKIEADGKVKIPPRLIETLNIVSISTTRGVLFSTFKGTFLHGAVLPIIDPKQFQGGSQKVEKLP
jgi:hypothetical protein